MHKQATDHTLSEPTGKSRTRRLINPVPRKALDRAQRRSFTATCKLRQKLLDTRVEQVNGIWCHVRRNCVVASFGDDVGAAVAAL